MCSTNCGSLNRSYLIEGKLEEEIDQAVAQHSGDQLQAWVERRFQTVPDAGLAENPGLRILERMTSVVGHGYSVNGVPPQRG